MGAEEFDYAKDRVWDLPRTPENHELLELYKL
jgi:acyl-CoA-binding protein